MSTILDGKSVADIIIAELKQKADRLAANKIIPTLAIVVATADESAKWYVRAICRTAESSKITAKVIDLGPDANAQELATALSNLADDEHVSGIILQTPLPSNVNIDDLLPLIPVSKDVDAANPASLGRLAAGLSAFAPATALAALRLLKHYQIPLAGINAVVVGRSRIVGLPAALLLLSANATVTICHSKTQDLASVTRNADVLVVAAGNAGLIGPEHVKSGAVVIDVGTNVEGNGNLVGDVQAEVANIAGALSPVPGGVGPVTTALLLEQTVLAAHHNFLKDND
jgi:methylenetetrahydrofolate dehydrogenase (NADP+)/methenyltetrahydrofolate cyclohydrolase